MKRFVEEPQRKTPVKRDEYDVLVAGSGPAGLIAAIAAARMGARTLLVERLGCLGGNLTSGAVQNIRQFNDKQGRLTIGGIPLEFTRRLMERGDTLGEPETELWVRQIPESTKLVAQEMAIESGVDLLLHSTVVGVVKRGVRVKGVILENKSGREAVLAKVIVDGTGDGDVFALGGAAFEKRGKGEVMPPTLAFILGGLPAADWPNLMTPERHKAMHDAWEKYKPAIPRQGAGIFPLARPGFAYVNGTRCFADCTDVDDLTQAEIDGRRQVYLLCALLSRHVPGFQDCYVVSTGATIGPRESRRLHGLHTLTEQDVLGGKEFDDRIARGSYAIDVHSGSDATTLMKHLPPGVSYAIPYRALVPEKLDGVLAAGRCISADVNACGSIRVMATCMALGHAAGAAAAMAATQGKRLRELDVTRLQDELRRQNAVLEMEVS